MSLQIGSCSRLCEPACLWAGRTAAATQCCSDASGPVDFSDWLMLQFGVQLCSKAIKRALQPAASCLLLCDWMWISARTRPCVLLVVCSHAGPGVAVCRLTVPAACDRYKHLDACGTNTGLPSYPSGSTSVGGWCGAVAGCCVALWLQCSNAHAEPA